MQHRFDGKDSNLNQEGQICSATQLESSQEVNIVIKTDIKCDKPNNNTKKNDKHHGLDHYVPRKPKWWRRIAGRRGTPGQRKAIARMTNRGYVISTKILDKKHNLEISLFKVFSNRPNNGTPRNPMDFLVPRCPRDSYRQEISREDVTENSNIAEESMFHDAYVCLEIGFGSGDVLLANATKFPNRYFIGAEIHQPGVGVALMRMEKDLDVVGSAHEKLPPYENLRIYPGDGVKLLDMMPSRSLNSIYLTFPDPWPQDDDQCWRVIQEDTVDAIGRVLKPGGCFYLATDSVDFYQWTQYIFERVQTRVGMHEMSSVYIPWEQVLPCPDRRDWLPVISKYEEKGLAEGRSTICQCWMKTYNSTMSVEP